MIRPDTTYPGAADAVPGSQAVGSIPISHLSLGCHAGQERLPTGL